MISRWRSRSQNKVPNSTFLPTYQTRTNATVNNIPPPPSKQRRSRIRGVHNIYTATPADGMLATTPTCTNFLMGGSYYPGKDKQRRHHHRNARYSILYRIFCSNPARVTCTILVVSYVVIRVGVMPGFQWLLQFGDRFAGGVGVGISSNTTAVELNTIGMKLVPHELWKEEDAEWQLKPLMVRKVDEAALLKQFEKMEFGAESRIEKKLRIFEEIIPKWFHRNDALEGENEEKEGDKEEKEEKDEKENDSKKDKLSDISHQGQKEEKQSEPKLERNNEMTKEAPPERTLHNMQHHGQNSQCPTTNQSISTTLVLQTTVDRIDFVLETCERWKDSPIVLVLYLSDEVEVKKWTKGTEGETLGWLKMECPNVEVILHEATSAAERNLKYPVNALRNKGLDAVKTSHVLVMDVDFIPSLGLDGVIRDVLVARRNRDSTDTVQTRHMDAIVVPAFERKLAEPCKTIEECKMYLLNDQNFIPRTMNELVKCHNDDKECIVFQSDVNWDGHHSTHSEEWLKGDWYEDGDISGLEDEIDTNRTLKKIPCFESYRYEPYVVIPWCHPTGYKNGEDALPSPDDGPLSPYYDERFYGYGKNKIQQIAHLRMKGYSFSILPKGFITHHPHPESKTKETWNNRDQFELHQKMDNLYISYLRDLSKNYGDSSRAVKMCGKHDH